MKRAISILVVFILVTVVFFPPAPALSAVGHGMHPALRTHEPSGNDHSHSDVDIPDNDLHLPDAVASGRVDPARRFLPVLTDRPLVVTSRFINVLLL